MSSSESNLQREGTLVISCGTLTAEQVILRIIDLESLPDTIVQSWKVKGFPWSFDTKYYSAEVNIFALEEKEVLDADFCDTIRAVVFYFDSQKPSSFDEILTWMPSIKDIEAEVKLMVCNNNSDESDSTDLERKKIIDWCVKNQFELVELNPSPDSDDEEEGAIKTAKGYDRVIEALQSHTWANLIMKNEMTDPLEVANEDPSNIGESQDKGASATNTENLEIDFNAAGGSAEANAKSCKKIAVEGEELQLEEKWLSNVLCGEDPEGESLEALFGKFASMKDKANGLSGDERKKYAEKVAIAFWEAMGGDKDEIDGLDDLED